MNSLDNIFKNTFLAGLVFRFLIIRYADRGLVVKGKPYLMLLNQIYWTFFGALVCIGLFYPLSLIFQGKLEKTNANQLCLNLPLEETYTPNMQISAHAISALVFFFTQYLTYRTHRYLGGICPAKKMSCIGNFRRNIISYDINRIFLYIYLSRNIIHPTVYHLAITYPKKFHPKYLLWFSFSFFTLRLIVFYVFIVYMTVTHIEVPQYKVETFYVRKPCPEPKRDYLGGLNHSPPSILVKRMNPHGFKLSD